MAEQNQEDRQFDPTQKRIDEFRREGRVALSRDVMSGAQLVAAALAFGAWGAMVFGGMLAGVRAVVQRVGDPELTLLGSLVVLFDDMAIPTLAVALPVAFAGILAALAQTRLNWSSKALGFKASRINPQKRLGDIFGKKLPVNLGLMSLKLAGTAAVLAVLIDGSITQIKGLAYAPLGGVLASSFALFFTLLMGTTVVLGLIAALDYAWQRRQHNQQLKMTREELKRDIEESEGKPEIKQRRRRFHMELSQNRILREVPQADVIVTNPTHLAIALKYTPGVDAAPRVTAKAADELAAHVRALARKHGVPLVENKPLARTLWARVKPDRAVPADLYQAVAEVLAQVYRRRQQRTGGATAGPRITRAGARPSAAPAAGSSSPGAAEDRAGGRRLTMGPRGHGAGPTAPSPDAAARMFATRRPSSP